MSLLVRHKTTGDYLQSHCLWNSNPTAAMQFNSGLKLVDYIEHGGIREKPDQVEVIVLEKRPIGEA